VWEIVIGGKDVRYGKPAPTAWVSRRKTPKERNEKEKPPTTETTKKKKRSKQENLHSQRRSIEKKGIETTKRRGGRIRRKLNQLFFSLKSKGWLSGNTKGGSRPSREGTEPTDRCKSNLAPGGQRKETEKVTTSQRGGGGKNNGRKTTGKNDEKAHHSKKKTARERANGQQTKKRARESQSQNLRVPPLWGIKKTGTKVTQTPRKKKGGGLQGHIEKRKGLSSPVVGEGVEKNKCDARRAKDTPATKRAEGPWRH